MVLRLVLGEDVMVVVCAYAPHARLGDQEKKEFRECLDAIVGAISRDERICIGGDFNGHIGKDNDGFQGVHGGFGFGNRNETGTDLLDFALAHDLGIINSFFKKRDSHLITFRSGGRNTQIDYLLMRQGDRRWWKDCKVIPGETVVAQHQLLVADIGFRNTMIARERNFRPRIRWGNLKDEKLSLFREKLVSSNLVQLDGDSSQMWEDLATKITQVAKETLGFTTGKASGYKESWWWNEIVQNKIRDKQWSFSELMRCTNEEERVGLRETYKKAKREAKKAVSEAKNMAYKQIRITQEEVRNALRKMGRAKAVGLDNIPIEVWKCLGEEGVMWLTTLFNTILKTEKMPDQWRSSVVVPIYKNKGDAQCCGNYRGIKLLSHTMKLWERVIDVRLKRETHVKMNQFRFMPGRSTTEAIHILRRLMEKYRDKKLSLHMVFIDLEKAYDSVPRQLLWDCLESKGVRGKYIKIIRDMYAKSETSVRAPVRDTDFFPVEAGLHQGSALSPFLFVVVLDKLSKLIHPWCMLFADDFVLIAESKQDLNMRLEEWRSALESKGLKISRSKTEYLYCDFGGVNDDEDVQIAIEGQEVP
ncbi:uncharacterized protein LOC143609136 [Bidens hawaiensis]|uniref:uncharacterized protein LOC143609136 n=1 Tax=Bidens hawaiensis TaxID=980011 RepID=UPI00404989F2